ncbi:nectin-3-like protein isoform X3 [Sparus aurata]|uniref:nectin-3-like protein isoform X3 n=1 Tax=Sparus aurata TaxID=8175 RepID=UPI0011C0F11F|nr:nectin-3-like protein isoform X3 [Sparus aurata]
MESTSLCVFYDKLWKPCFFRSNTMFILVSATILSALTEGLQVIGGNKTVAQGETVVLPCKLIDTTETLSQISWQRTTRGKPRNENFFTILPKDGPKFVDGYDERFRYIGIFDDNNGSLQLSDVTLMDEGIYTCIFTLFPSGNHKTEIPLNLLVPPVSSLEANTPVLDDKEVLLVTCTAAASKPPAEVRWLTGDLAGKLRATTNSTEHGNGTTTTMSSLFGIPSREINHHLVQCDVTNAALANKQTLPFTIQVHFPPTDVIISQQASNSFECVTEANPDANFTWNRSDNSWPQSAVRVEGATLQFLSMTSDLNGLYQCEASNPYGTKRSHLYLHVSSGNCAACWTLFSLLLILNVAAAALLYLHKSGKLQRIREIIFGDMQPVPQSPSAPDNRDRQTVPRSHSTSDRADSPGDGL